MAQDRPQTGGFLSIAYLSVCCHKGMRPIKEEQTVECMGTFVLCLQLGAHFKGYTGTKRISSNAVGSFRLYLLHTANVVGCQALYTVHRSSWNIEASQKHFHELRNNPGYFEGKFPNDSNVHYGQGIGRFLLSKDSWTACLILILHIYLLAGPQCNIQSFLFPQGLNATSNHSFSLYMSFSFQPSTFLVTWGCPTRSQAGFKY